MNFLKTTVVGGFLFLVPVAVIAIAVGKAFDLVRSFVLWIQEQVPGIKLGGIVVIDLIAVTAIVLVCFLAGLFARSDAGKRLGKRIDEWLLSMLPGYSFIKGLTDNLRTSEEQSRDFVPVVARFDDNSQLAFEVERTSTGGVVLYVPGCPDPWSGSVMYVSEDRVEPIEMSVSEALKSLRTLGRGSAKFADKIG